MTNQVSETYGSLPYPSVVRLEYRLQESGRYHPVAANSRDDPDRTAVVLGVGSLGFGDTNSGMAPESPLRTHYVPADRIWRKP